MLRRLLDPVPLQIAEPTSEGERKHHCQQIAQDFDSTVYSRPTCSLRRKTAQFDTRRFCVDREKLPVTFVSLTTYHRASLLPRLDFVLTPKACSLNTAQSGRDTLVGRI